MGRVVVKLLLCGVCWRWSCDGTVEVKCAALAPPALYISLALSLSAPVSLCRVDC